MTDLGQPRNPRYPGAWTAEARKKVQQSGLSTPEIIRRLGTSATQFYRLLDRTDRSKSLKQ